MTVPLSEWRLGHRLWIEGPEIFRRLHWTARTTIVAASLYAFGGALAVAFGMASLYLGSWAFVVGAVGCGFVAVAIAQRASRIDELYFELSTTFEVPRSLFLREVGLRFERACRPGWHIATGLLVLAPLVVATVYSVILFDQLPPDGRLSALRPVGFAPGLYQGELQIGTFAIVTVYAMAISLVLGTAVYLAGSVIGILFYLRRLPVPPLAESVRMRLRGIADLHLHISRDWTIGVLLFALLFGAHIDPFSIAVLSVIGLIALALFFIPQSILREVIIRAHRRATEISIVEWRRGDDQGTTWTADQMVSMTEISAPPRYWVYGSSEFSLWILAQAVAVVALVLQVVRPDAP